MWTTENSCRYDRSHLRHESDLTDEKWFLHHAVYVKCREQLRRQAILE
jgi:hypothetical protein